MVWRWCTWADDFTIDVNDEFGGTHAHCGIHGQKVPDVRAMGYPLDRPIVDFKMTASIPNFKTNLIKIYHKPSELPSPPFFPSHDYSKGHQNEGQDYGRITGPDWPNPRPEPSPSPSPWFNPPVTGAGPGGPGGCMDRCLKAGKLHPSQCHAMC